MSEGKSYIKAAFKWLLILVAAGYLIFALVKVVKSTDNVVCTGIDLMFEDSTDNQLINSQDIQRMLTANKIAPKGLTYSAIDMRQIDSVLTASPYIDTAKTYHTSSGQLCIRIKTRRPILHVMGDNGDEFYIDSAGVVMPKGGLNTNLCIVTGKVNRKYASKHLKEIGQFLCDDQYWKLQTQQLNITKEGYIELVPRTGDLLILLGEPTNIKDKLERVRLFFEQGMTAAGWNKYKTISAEYDGQVVCTKK